MPIGPAALRLLHEHVGSIAQLELLELVNARPGTMSAQEAAHTLGAPVGWVADCLGHFTSARPVSLADELELLYARTDDEALAATIHELAAVHRRRPDLVQRLIVHGAEPGAGHAPGAAGEV